MYQDTTTEQLIATFEKMMQVDEIRDKHRRGQLALPLPPRRRRHTAPHHSPSPLKLRLLEMHFMEGSSTTPFEQLALNTAQR